MNTNRIRLMSIGLAAATTLGVLGVAGPANAKAGDVVRTGNCSAASDWKLKLGPRDGHIETEFQVDSNIAGQTWNVKLFHNGTRVLRTQATTTAPSGSFDVRLQMPDAEGRDVVDATATNPATHETCTAQARVSAIPSVPVTDAIDDTTAPVDHPRPRRGVVALQVGQFALVGIVALAIVGLATAIASRRVGEREAIAEARTTTLSKVQGPVEHLVTDDLLNGSPAAVAAVDQAVRDGVIDRDLVRVKIWRQDGTIIYSDEPQLIGTQYALGTDELASLQTGAIQAHVSDLGEAENRFERQYGKLLEVYLPIQSASQPVLFEAYYRYAIVEDNGSQLFRSFAPIALGALVVLELIQIPLFWSLARRLRQRLREREALLRRTVEASDIERRQIASDLHDGAVQDLAGVAYALLAAARRHETGDDVTPVIEESAETVRNSIRALRSLIVDIYPPDFGEVPLDSALSDLLGRASDQGLDVALDMDGLGDRPVPEATARLLYRAAQEGVRNTLAHAQAHAVTVQLSRVDSMAVMDVTDDGQGVDETELAQRRADGHVGLTALGGLIADAGGHMELRPARDHGAILHVEVPLA